MKIELISGDEMILEVKNGDTYAIEERSDGFIEIHKNNGAEAIKVSQEFAAWADCHTTVIK